MVTWWLPMKFAPTSPADHNSGIRKVLFEVIGEKPIVLMFLTVFFLQGASALLHMSATADETHYLGMGVYLIENRDWTLLDDALLHPPLSYYLHSIPLFFIPIDQRVFDIDDINERGRTLMASRSDELILNLARVPILLMGTLLGLLVYGWGRQAYGRWAALLALALYVFNPVMLSNASLITPDLCLTFFAVLTFYCIWRFLVAQQPLMLVASGTAMGLCLLSKYSAVLVVLSLPLFMVFQATFRPVKEDPAKTTFRPSHFAVILLVAVLVVNGGYFFVGSFEFVHDEEFKSQLFRDIQNTTIFQWMPLPIPRHYVMGVDLQYTVVEEGFNYFLLGERSKEGWFHYYLVSFLMKSPVAFLLLLAGAVFLSLRSPPNRLQLLLLAPVLLFPFYFSVFKISRGIRYILVVYPLLCVWISRIVVLGQHKNRFRTGTLYVVLLSLLVVESVWVMPHYLAYFNAAVGGPSRGQNYLFESEFDWGQELKGLESYMRRNSVERIQLAYFGTADPRHYGIDFDPLECAPTRENDGLIAVSATAMQFWGCFDWLSQYEPLDRIGYTIFLYDIPPKP